MTKLEYLLRIKDKKGLLIKDETVDETMMDEISEEDFRYLVQHGYIIVEDLFTNLTYIELTNRGEAYIDSLF